MVGYASRATYVGTDTHLGSLNLAESFGTENLIHWVFDFATNAANGTINSVCWGYTWPETPNSYMIPAIITGSNWSWFGKCARQYNEVEYGDGYFWGYVAGTGTVYKLDPVSLLELASYVLTGFATAHFSFIVNGGYIYYPNNSFNLCKFNYSTLAITTSATTVCYNGGMPATPQFQDGTYIYLSCMSYTTALPIIRVKLADLTIMDTKANLTCGGTNIYACRLMYVGGVMYNVTPSNLGANLGGVYSFNYTTGVATYLGPYITDYTYWFTDGTNTYTSYSSSYYCSAAPGNSYHIATIPNANPSGIKNFNLMARKFLGSPITKTSAKTMKIIYDFTMS